MPPKVKITGDMILHAALDITRKQGFGQVNARSVSSRLECSTRPIFTAYKNMEDMKADFLEFAYVFYRQYVERYETGKGVEKDLLLPLSYLAFAEEEPHLFQLLFIDDMALDLKKRMDFYSQLENGEKADDFARRQRISRQRAREIFLDLFLYTHGMAVLTATGKMCLGEQEKEEMVRTMLWARIHWGREKETE